MTRETRDQKLENLRPKRVPIHEQKRNILTVTNRDPNYHYRIVNDVGDRVDKFKLAGYEIVEHEVKVGETGVVNGNVSLGTGARINVGANRTAVLMRIPKELYIEDQKVKQKDILAKERLMIRKVNKKSTESDEDGSYGEVSLGTK